MILILIKQITQSNVTKIDLTPFSFVFIIAAILVVDYIVDLGYQGFDDDREENMGVILVSRFEGCVCDAFKPK